MILGAISFHLVYYVLDILGTQKSTAVRKLLILCADFVDVGLITFDNLLKRLGSLLIDEVIQGLTYKFINFLIECLLASGLKGLNE